MTSSNISGTEEAQAVNVALAPCPFCGWKTPHLCHNKDSASSWVTCDRCGARSGGFQEPTLADHMLRDFAVNEWNRRPAPSLPQDVAKLIAEYRPSMPVEVLHLWAEDVKAALTSQSAALASAREVIEPFAQVANAYDDREDDDFQVWMDIGISPEVRAASKLKNFRAARTALETPWQKPGRAAQAQAGEKPDFPADEQSGETSHVALSVAQAPAQPEMQQAVTDALERYRAQEPFGGDMVSNPQGDWVRFDDAMAKIAALQAGEADGWREDTARLDALRDNSWDLRCFDIATGGGDYDIGWRVIGHWQAEPQERVVGEVYNDDPRAAIDAALAPASKEERE